MMVAIGYTKDTDPIHNGRRKGVTSRAVTWNDDYETLSITHTQDIEKNVKV